MKTALHLLVLCCCGPLLASARLTTVPENDAVFVGSTVELNCSAFAGERRIMWIEFATSPSGMIISDGKDLISSHPNSDRYSIIGGPDDFILQIRDVTLADGGTYMCQDLLGAFPETFRGYAELVVLESDPVCEDFVSVTGVVLEGSSYSSECEIHYKGNLAPRMEWVGPGNFATNGSTTPTSVWAWKRFTADREMEGGFFNCHTDFGPVIAEPGHANNTPEYTNTYFGPRINVNWAPKDMSITPIQSQYHVGDVLTCSCDSKPAAKFLWTNMLTLVTEPPGETFTITEDIAGQDQTMRCNAEVLIEGSLYTQNIFANVSVAAVTTPTVSTTPTPTTPTPEDAPCNDLTGQWRSTNPNAQLCVEMDSKGNLLTLIRNGSDPYFVAGNGKTQFNDYKHIGFTGIWPPGEGAGGFTGECHNCYGNEVILLSGLARNKANAPGCGESAGTQFTPLYVLTRSGPPCRGLELDVYNPKPWVSEIMGVKVRPYKKL